jgi:hypothetical protein
MNSLVQFALSSCVNGKLRILSRQRDTRSLPRLSRCLKSISSLLILSPRPCHLPSLPVFASP